MICQQRKSTNYQLAKLTKGKLKAFITQKFTGAISDKVARLFSNYIK